MTSVVLSDKIIAVHKMSTKRAKFLLNLWPPLIGAGIRILEASPDFRYIRVRLRQYPLNRNAFGTHFGGSIFAMTDPFYALLLSRHLGSDYVVWDKAAEIEYIAPGRGDLFAEFAVDDTVIESIKAEVADGAKHLRWFEVPVRNRDGELIAAVRRQLYVRMRQPPSGR